jgi:hypothetical protein
METGKKPGEVWWIDNVFYDPVSLTQTLEPETHKHLGSSRGVGVECLRNTVREVKVQVKVHNARFSRDLFHRGRERGRSLQRQDG